MTIVTAHSPYLLPSFIKPPLILSITCASAWTSQKGLLQMMFVRPRLLWQVIEILAWMAAVLYSTQQALSIS